MPRYYLVRGDQESDLASVREEFLVRMEQTRGLAPVYGVRNLQGEVSFELDGWRVLVQPVRSFDERAFGFDVDVRGQEQLVEEGLEAAVRQYRGVRYTSNHY